MVATTRKRKAVGSQDTSEKRIRVEKPVQSSGVLLNTPTLHLIAEASSEGVPVRFEDDEDEDDYRNDGDESVDEDNSQTADTPLTPFSPRKKFPSELKTIKCTFEGCTKTFNRPARLEAHLRAHNDERPFVCTYESCNKSYHDQKHLKQHVKGSHTNERSYQCHWEGCSKSFLTATRLRRHIDTHEGNDRFKCTEFPPCNQTFRKHQTLQRHIRSHLHLAPYPCTYIDLITFEPCNAGFDGAVGLRKHEDRVHGLPRFFCPDCTISGLNPDGSPIHLGFTTETKLKSHIKKEHANCAFCDLKCSSQRELQKHIETRHSGTTLEQRKNVSCTYPGCDKTFTKNYNRDVHIRNQHEGVRYICGTFDVSKVPDLASFDDEDACGKDFVSKANLEDHIRTAHLGLLSLINRNRKSASNSDDEEDVDEPSIQGKKQKRRNGSKPKLSAIDELLGTSYAADPRRNIPCLVTTCPHLFIRDYDLQQHMRTKHRLSTAEVEDLAAEIENAPEFEFPVEDARNDDAYGGEGGEEEDDRVELDDMYEQADMDWEIQRRALEGGPFWMDADDGDFEQGGDQWTQDELEMRRLIGGGDMEGLVQGSLD